MKKTTLLILLACILLSCGPNWNNPDETIYIIPKAKEWIVDDPEMLDFNMLGSDSTLLHFKENNSNFGIGGSSASSDGFLSGYYIIARERYSQHFLINDSIYRFRIEMEPSSNKDMGNQLTINLLNSGWQYDLSYNKLTFVSLDLPSGHNSKWSNRDNISSSIELLDSLTIHNTVCDSVMHFTLSDFTDKFTGETVTELYYAKHIGLVKFVKHSGVDFERVW